MPEVVVGIGSNIDRSVNIAKGLDRLVQQFTDLQLSSVYESASATGLSHYYNLVASFTTTLPLEELRAVLKAVEQQCGREKVGEDVAIDIDLLLYDDLIDGALPHQDILAKAYVLRPLAELLPAIMHPEKQQTFQELWNNFDGIRSLQAVDFVWSSRLISVAPASLPL